MKVLMINKFLYPNGGSETYILKIDEMHIKAVHFYCDYCDFRDDDFCSCDAENHKVG